MRAEAQADIGTAVADDLARGQLAADCLVVVDAHRNRAAAARRITRGPRLEPVLVEELEQERRLLERALADPGDADLLDHVVACGGGVEGGHVGRPGQEARGAVRVVLPRLEGEGPRVRLPAGHCGLEPFRKFRAHVQPGGPGPAAEPLDRTADREVDAERGHVQRHGAGRLVRVEHDERALLVGPGDDRLDVLDLAGLVENVGDRHEQRPLVDRLRDPGVVGRDDDLEARRRLVEVAHRGEVALLVDDLPPLAAGLEAREDDRLGDGDVLVHRDAPGGRADDPGDLVADGQRQLPPALLPGAHAAGVPGARVLEHALLDRGRHRAQRVVDQVGRLREDREPVAVAEQVAHEAESTASVFPIPRSRDFRSESPFGVMGRRPGPA